MPKRKASDIYRSREAKIAGRVAWNVGKYLFKKGAKRGARYLQEGFKNYVAKRRRRYGRGSVARYLSHHRVRARNRSRRDRMDMKKVKCFINSRTALHTRRVRRSGTLSSLVNKAAYASDSTLGTLVSVEGSTASLRYFDPATNTIVTQSPGVGTYQRDICMSIHRKLKVRNNYQVPCHVQIWSCVPKDATSLSALSCFNSGMADQGNPDTASPRIYFTDSMDLKNIYNIQCLVNRRLMPGQEATAVSVAKRFDYTYAANDVHNLTYQKKQGGHNFVIRIVGEISHDTVQAEVSHNAAGIDWIFDGVVRIEYDAGKNLTDYSLDDNTPNAFTNSGVLTNRPIADNQGYSKQ